MDSEKNKKGRNLIKKATGFIKRDIWDIPRSELKGFHAFYVDFLRIVITTVDGIINKRILVQASSLSYATLLAIGPILAITIIFSAMFFRDKGKTFIYEKITEVATFVMPAFNEIDVVKEPSNDVRQIKSSMIKWQTAGQENLLVSTGKMQAKKTSQLADETLAGVQLPPDADIKNPDADASKKINPRIAEFIGKILKGSASAGAIGMLTMLFTCVLLCKNMESAFNYIWGVTKGRSIMTQVVFYFTLIFFGSVGLMFGMTFLATSHFASYVKGIPFIADYAPKITYVLGLLVMVSVLASFYKFIPYTKVKWRAAFFGALVIMLLLILNNQLSFVYINYIVKQQSFYGYLAIVAVAMFSLYVFWTMILTGGQIAYAVQYVDFLSDGNAWLKMGGRTKRLCALAVFAEISRNFCELKTHSPRIEDIVIKLHLPKVVVWACIEWLESKNLVCMIDDEKVDGYYFKPSIPPEAITLGEFFNKLCLNDGDEDVVRRLEVNEPAIGHSVDFIRKFSESELPAKKIKDIL